MNDNDPTPRRVLAAQGVIALISVALAWVLAGPPAVLSAMLGFVIAAVNTLLVARDTYRMTARAAGGEGGALATLYAGAATRYAGVVAGFGLGIGVAGLPPLPAIATFAAAQMAYGLALRSKD